MTNTHRNDSRRMNEVSSHAWRTPRLGTLFLGLALLSGGCTSAQDMTAEQTRTQATQQPLEMGDMDVVRVYADDNYHGASQDLVPGLYDTGQLTVGNDTISSLRVPSGWKVTLFSDANFSGSTREYTADADLWRQNDFNDQTSSILVMGPRAHVYSDGYYGGADMALTPGRYDFDQVSAGVGNDTVSSVRVPKGWRVTLFSDANFSGAKKVLTASTDFTADFNDLTSSILVEAPFSRRGNTLYGRWLGSGGSAAEQQFKLDYTGPGESVILDVTSTVQGSLALVEANDCTEISHGDAGGGKLVSRLSCTLQPGTYTLRVMSSTGQTGDFTLSSNRAMLRFPKQLKVKPATSYTNLYANDGMGTTAMSVWQPAYTSEPGYYSLGDVFMANQSPGQTPLASFVAWGEGDVLAPPSGYRPIWWDASSSAAQKVSFWAPIPQAGYTCLGSVVSLNLALPSTNRIRCVKSEYVLSTNASSLGWMASGSPLLAVWQANPMDYRGVNLSSMLATTFTSILSITPPASSDLWMLNKSATATPEWQGAAVDGLTAMQYAPGVWLQQDESYFPAAVETFLPNVHEDNGNMVTNQSLGCDSCTAPSFLYGQRPSQTQVPMYAQIINRTSGGVPTNVTDIVYWTFYPYNNGKRVCIGYYNSSIGCIGGYSTFGNHVGDWEQLTVRFVDGRPSQVYMSQHEDGQGFTFGDKMLTLTAGMHPEVYSAQGSHGLYPDAARHIYQNLPNGDFLADDTSRGSYWAGWVKPVIIPWQPLGTYLDNLTWLNSSLRWGNHKANCDVSEPIAGECVLDDGPVGPMLHGVDNAANMNLE